MIYKWMYLGCKAGKWFVRGQREANNQSKSELVYRMLYRTKSLLNKQTTSADFLEKKYVFKGLGKMAYSVNAS